MQVSSFGITKSTIEKTEFAPTYFVSLSTHKVNCKKETKKQTPPIAATGLDIASAPSSERTPAGRLSVVALFSTLRGAVTMERESYIEGGRTVQSGMAWGPIFGGVFVAFVVMIILNTLGLAVGLTGQEGVGTGFAIWSIVVALISLFAGSYAMSFLEANASREHVMIHGVVLWGVLLFGLLILAAAGLQVGVAAILGTANIAAGQIDLGAFANQLGMTQQELREMQAQAQENLPGAPGVWWTLVGMLASLGAVLAGAAAGFKRRAIPVSYKPTNLRGERPLQSRSRTSA